MQYRRQVSTHPLRIAVGAVFAALAVVAGVADPGDRGLNSQYTGGGDPSYNRFVRDGVSVELALAPADGAVNSPAPLAGDAARIRFTITDTTTHQPVTRLRPAAWLSRRGTGSAAQPRTCGEKVQELLGGSIFSKAELDLNTFQVITLNDDATLTVVDPLFGFGGTKLLALIALPGIGADWALTSDGKKLFVAVPAAGKVAVVDTATWKLSGLLDAGAAPHRVVVQPDGHYVWVASAEENAQDDTDRLTVISTDRAAVVASISIQRGPHEIVFSADSRWAFVTSVTAQMAAVIDVHRLQKTKDVPLGCVPSSAAYAQASEAVYLTDERGGKIVVLDAVRHEIVDRIPAEPGVSELKFAPGGRFGFAANPTRDLVEILDTATNRIVQRAKIEAGPEQFGFSDDMAFVLCRRTAKVSMIPLKEIGHQGRAVPVAEFTGGEAPFGGPTKPAARIVAAPGESAVILANAMDKTVYYYMQGMAAPMGNFSNYGREPRAVLVLDRSLREVAPGVYETFVDLPAAGAYDAVFFLDSPRIAHCFDAPISPNPAREQSHGTVTTRLRPTAQQKLVAGERIRLGFQLEGETAVNSSADITLLVVLTPGIWHSRQTVTPEPDRTVTFEFTPPQPGTYQFYAESSLFGRESNRAPVLVLQAREPLSVSTP